MSVLGGSGSSRSRRACEGRRHADQHGFWVGLALGLFFSLGFLAATVLTPSADAQQSTGRWQYRTIDHGWDQGRWANEAGREGWRFVGFEYGNPHKLLFERPL